MDLLPASRMETPVLLQRDPTSARPKCAVNLRLTGWSPASRRKIPA